MRRVSLKQLIRHVDVEPLEASRHFIGRSVDLGWGRVYGGQTMAQGVAAAQHVAGPERSLHHFSCHFLRGGDAKLPILFEVDQLTSGRSFSAMHVRAVQEEQPILVMTASFQTPEVGLMHQWRDGLKAEWGKPDDFRPLTELMEPYLDKIPERVRGIYSEGVSPIETRPATEMVLPWDPTQREPTKAVWVRASEAMPDDSRVHERLLTYVSDWGLLETAIYPHATALWRPEMQVASLSHSMYFHHSFRMDQQWLCHVMHSPVSSGGRGYALGEFWTEDGKLVASTAQEGLMRQRASNAKDAGTTAKTLKNWVEGGT